MTSQLYQAEYIRLYTGNLVPLYVIAPCLVWVLHDYFVTLEDEIRYVWSQNRGWGKFLFFFIRYYTILLLAFDTAQIHAFAIKGVPTEQRCLFMDPFIRITGAVCLWAVEIVMQMRIYALYDRSRKVAMFNACFFLLSIVAFVGILAVNALHRPTAIAAPIKYPLPGCPTINRVSISWAVWVPATLFEFNLFGLAVYKCVFEQSAGLLKIGKRVSLVTSLFQENMLYFIGITMILILNLLMTIPGSRVPWLSYGPFHAGLGIMTCRMHIHLRKHAVQMTLGQMDVNTIQVTHASAESQGSPRHQLSAIRFAPSLPSGDEERQEEEYPGSRRVSDEESLVASGSGSSEPPSFLDTEETVRSDSEEPDRHMPGDVENQKQKQKASTEE